MNNWNTSKPPKNRNHWFINYIAKYKAANLVWGSGYFLHSNNEKINDFLKKLEKENNLFQTLYKQEQIFSINGVSVMWLEQNPYFETFQIRINNPLFPVYIENKGEKVVSVLCVETRQRSAQGSVSYELIKLTQNTIQYSNTIAQPQMLATVQNFQLARFTKTKNQMFIYSLNLPKYNPYFININYSNPDTNDITDEDLKKLDSYWKMIERDQYVSQNRILTKDKPTYDENMEETELKYLKSSVILQDESISLFGGVDLKTEFLKGTSQNKAWWENFENCWNTNLRKSGYGKEKGESGGATASEIHYSKGDETQTTAIKRKIRTENILNLLDSALMEKNLWDGKGPRPYIFKINDHFIVDKSKHLENTAKELALGKPLSMIVMEANNISKSQAYEQLKEAQKDIRDFPELFNMSGTYLQNGDPTNPDSKTAAKQKENEINR